MINNNYDTFTFKILFSSYPHFVTTVGVIGQRNLQRQAILYQSNPLSMAKYILAFPIMKWKRIPLVKVFGFYTQK